MKTIIPILGAALLVACTTVKSKPPKVDTAPIGMNLDRIGESADDLDALANDMEARGQ